MKKIGIITINDNYNYGNRLQNFAVSYTLEKLGYHAETIGNVKGYHNKNIKRRIKYIYSILCKLFSKKAEDVRLINFIIFNKNIKKSRYHIDVLHTPIELNDKYDYFVVGSDQVWNVNFNTYSLVNLLFFANKEKRVSFSASFGISELPEKYHEEFSTELNKFKAVSVREHAGKEIVENLTERKDVEVLIDPTMLLDTNEWDKVIKKPKILKNKRFVLNYFLGELSEKRRIEIERVAKELNCEIISILDKNSPFYQCGPSEFLYLEKYAQLICTDSFHSCVFAILFNRPFVIFEREGSIVGMNSRLDTLLRTFELKHRKFNCQITEENLKHDYTYAYEILEKEREKSLDFLKRNLK